MSCFIGRMNEYRFISIDRFDGDNFLSRMYFLSHCHEDHMVGLDSPRFMNHLTTNGYSLYVHQVTYHLLLHDHRFRHLEPRLVQLSANEPHLLNVPFASVGDQPANAISVTLLPAGHCPGSVMFLFEGWEGNVLYTGDIRLKGEDLAEMTCLSTGDQVKPIRSVYFDSTFCTLATANIVDRHESLSAIVKLTRQHLDNSPRNRVLLYCAQKYGHEFLMRKLSEDLDTKIHVTDSKYALYKNLSDDIGDFVTSDGLSTRVHACAFYNKEDEELSLVSKSTNSKTKLYRQKCTPYSTPSCPHCRPWDKEVLIIKPSMLWFMQSRSVDKVAYFDHIGRIYRVQYSCHSSLAEIRELLVFLRPQFAYPNVRPYGSKDYGPVQEAIQDVIPNIGDCLPFKSTRKGGSAKRCCAGNDCISDAISVSSSEKNFSCRNRYLETNPLGDKRQKLDSSTKCETKVALSLYDWSSCIEISDDGSKLDAASPNADEDQLSNSDHISGTDNARRVEREMSDIIERNVMLGSKCDGSNSLLASGIGSNGVDQEPALNESQCSDVDLFDVATPSTDDSEPKSEPEQPPSVVSMSSSKESVEYIGTYHKGEDPLTIELSSDEGSDSKDHAKESIQSTSDTKESIISVRSIVSKNILDDDDAWLRNAPMSASAKKFIEMPSSPLKQTVRSSRRYVL